MNRVYHCYNGLLVCPIHLRHLSLVVNKGFTTSFFDLDDRLSFDDSAEPG